MHITLAFGTLCGKPRYALLHAPALHTYSVQTHHTLSVGVAAGMVRISRYTHIETTRDTLRMMYVYTYMT